MSAAEGPRPRATEASPDATGAGEHTDSQQSPAAEAPSAAIPTPPRDLWRYARVLQPPDQAALARRTLITFSVLTVAWVVVVVLLAVAGLLPGGSP